MVIHDGQLLVLCISNLRDRLDHALGYIKLPALADDPVEIAVKEAVILCV